MFEVPQIFMSVSTLGLPNTKIYELNGKYCNNRRNFNSTNKSMKGLSAGPLY